MNAKFITDNISVSPARALAAGAASSVAMMTTSYAMRAAGLKAPDFAAQYGAILKGKHPKPFSAAWWAGFVWHAVNGTALFSFAYGGAKAKTKMLNGGLVTGALYGGAISALAGMTVAPMAHEGMFFRRMKKPLAMAVGASICWAVYGIVLSAIEDAKSTGKAAVEKKSFEALAA